MADAKGMMDNESPVFDPEDFLRRIDGDVELCHEVLGIFLEETPPLVAALIHGIKSQNSVAVERAAHTLKGAAANISAPRLHGLCQHLQSMVRKDAEADLAPMVAVFEKNFQDLDQTLRRYLKN